LASGLLLTLILTLGSGLETVRQAFELGQCEQVIKGLDTAVQDTGSRAGKSEIYRLTAICQFRSGRLKIANHLARAALRLAPGQALDPFLSPPQERAWYQKLLEEVPPPQPTVVERVVQVVSHVRHYRCIAPFGFCHWSRGDLEKGLPLAGLQLSGLGLNVFAWWMAEQQRDPLGYVRENRVDDLERWTVLQYSGAVIGLSALAADLWFARKERTDGLPASP
jgi:hypothetical protein